VLELRIKRLVLKDEGVYAKDLEVGIPCAQISVEWVVAATSPSGRQAKGKKTIKE
jgi:hypothetical protein